MLAMSTEIVIVIAVSAILAISVVAMAVFMVTYVRSSRKQIDSLKKNVSALYVRQTQAATVKTEAPKVRHEKPDFRAMMQAHDAGQAYTPEEAPQIPSNPQAQESVKVAETVAETKTAEPEETIRIAARRKPQEGLSDEALIEKLKELIEANISNPDLSIVQLANELCVSRSGLFAKVKAATGDTPNNMISEARLSRARVLLEEGKRPINEIGYMVGFSSPSYFSRCFLKRYGMTPHAWMSSRKS